MVTVTTFLSIGHEHQRMAKPDTTREERELPEMDRQRMAFGMQKYTLREAFDLKEGDLQKAT